MNKILAACAAITAYKLAFPKKAYAWFSKTHEDITTKAIGLLSKDNRVKEAEFFKPYKEQILAGCTKPDRKGDPDKGSGMHYYSICNKKGTPLPQTAGYYRNRKGKISKSARTMLEENYTSALCLYKSGKIPQAMNVLGRAAHFIEDMSFNPSSPIFLLKASSSTVSSVTCKLYFLLKFANSLLIVFIIYFIILYPMKIKLIIKLFKI